MKLSVVISDHWSYSNLM